ncbi:hypothetical protein KUTeg_010387 [Tegillarca granosa]|uniref:Uncharacterized protein n=1 Tax=Tegillarca granosa TaxID=220873 RepID=A0ABQ9F6K5_TEGGR|nr:hypothetical protein KUTeg_010387 [Tegillarca granosa]
MANTKLEQVLEIVHDFAGKFPMAFIEKQNQKAKAIIIKMAKINWKPVPVLIRIKIKEMVFSAYTFYAISFGVQKMSGSINLNIFLLSLVDLPSNLLTYYMYNKTILFFAKLFKLMPRQLLYLYIDKNIISIADPNTKGHVIYWFALKAKIGNSAAWCAIETLTAETYPIVIRNIGFGFHITLQAFSSTKINLVFRQQRLNIIIRKNDFKKYIFFTIYCSTILNFFCFIILSHK